MENFESKSYQDAVNEPNFIPSSLPNATAVLILGIISILGCCCYGIVGVICGIIALVLAKKDKALYTQNPNAYSNYETLKTGRILAIIGLILSVIYIITLIASIAVFGFEALTDQQLMQERMEELMNR